MTRNPEPLKRLRLFGTAAALFLSLILNGPAQTNHTRANKAPVVVTNTASISLPIRSVPTQANQAQSDLPPVVAVKAASTNAATKNNGAKSDLWLGLFGVILGACLAYGADWLKEYRKKHNEQHTGILRSQLALIGHLNTLNNIKTDYLDPVRHLPHREDKLIRYTMVDSSWRVPYDSIAFLLTTKNPTLVLEVHSAEQTYISAMHGLEARNQAYDQMHANSRLGNLNRNTGECIIQADPRHVLLVKQTTDSLYNTVDNAMERLTKAIKALYGAGKLLYPKRSFPLWLFCPKRGFLEVDGEKQ
jgi:hypothetical protein